MKNSIPPTSFTLQLNRTSSPDLVIPEMETLQAFLTALFMFSVVLMYPNRVDANFVKSTYFNWGADHCSISGNGDDLQLGLDQFSGSGIQSKQSFLFGSIEMLIKLVPGNSAGTVTAYYLSATGPKHDEIDFEFLGNQTGQPYTIHTNIFTQGVGNREQQFKPWFDPTSGYHNYTIHWNPSAVVWFIDSIPIRVFRNYESKGIAFTNKQGMRVYSSLWNADNWATQGGRIKIDWSFSPFRATYRRFRARACKWKGPISIKECAAKTPANWWTNPRYSRLNFAQQGHLQWVRNNSMIYDYCKDILRFNGKLPAECSLPQY